MRLRTSALGLTCAVLLGGCAQAVPVTPAPAGTSDQCAALAAAWPAEVAGLPRIDTDPQSSSTAAWGEGKEAAIIARCGVAVPGPTSDECIAVDDVDWIVHKLEDGMQMTTYGRDPAIEVLVPKDYAPETLLLPAFAQAARKAQATEHRCT